MLAHIEKHLNEQRDEWKKYSALRVFNAEKQCRGRCK